ncbi:ABC transporter ATP-binding protein/permease [Akkermansiaceae bacterium]|nr:ABC transporter ATP-binding protein/permease [Akkermansiaceae bacterium]
MKYFNIIVAVVRFFSLRGKKGSLFKLLAFAIFIAFLEGCTALVLIPFLNDLAGGNDETLTRLINENKVQGEKNIFIAYYSFLIIFFIFKGFSLFRYIRFTNNFMYSELHSFNKDMTVMNLNLRFCDFRNVKFSEVTRLIVSDSSQYFINFLNPLIILISEILVLSCLITISFIIIGKPILYAAILILIFSILYKKIKYQLRKYGVDQIVFNTKRIKFLDLVFKSYIEYSTHRRGDRFLNKFIHNDKIFTNASKKVMIFTQLPRIVIENFGYIVIVLTVLVLSYVIGYTKNEIIASVGLFLVIFIRAIPSLNKIYTSLGKIDYYKEVMNKIHQALSATPCGPIKKTKHESFDEIRIENLSFDYKGVAVLQGISLTIEKYDRIFISGESGSGKTTLVNLILGLLHPRSGNLFYNGKDLNLISKTHHFKYSFVFQENVFFEGNLLENIDLNCEMNDRSEIKSLMGQLCLDKYINELESFNIGDNGSLLSIGEKQRFALIRALIQKPEILFLDEFTSALDLENEKIVYNLLENLDLTIIFISHRPVPNTFYNKSITL